MYDVIFKLKLYSDPNSEVTLTIDLYDLVEFIYRKCVTDLALIFCVKLNVSRSFLYALHVVAVLRFF